MFHAAFEAYKENSPAWRWYYQKYLHPFDILLDITQNEGIAYYLTLDQLGRGYLPGELREKTQEAFNKFNSNAIELLSNKLTDDRVYQILMDANGAGD